MDNLVWVNHSCRHWHIDMARELLASRHLHQLPYFPVQPTSFNFKKLTWWDPWTSSKSCRSKLSINGDTAKYLVLTLCRGGALFPQDSVNLFCHDAHFAQMAKWRPRRDLLEAIPQTNPDALPNTTLCPSGWVLTTYLVKTEPIWLVVALEASRHWTCPISLFLGGRPQVRYTCWFRGSTTWP
jgi:hypothetical protein